LIDDPPPMLDYRNPTNPAFIPFAFTGMRFGLGMMLAGAALLVCLISTHHSVGLSDSLASVLIVAESIGWFRAVWALRNFGGSQLVERHRVVSVACGLVTFLVPAILFRSLPVSTIYFPIPVLLLMLLPLVLATTAGWTAFRRLGDAGEGTPP
jgi:hypothetical protein